RGWRAEFLSSLVRAQLLHRFVLPPSVHPVSDGGVVGLLRKALDAPRALPGAPRRSQALRGEPRPLGGPALLSAADAAAAQRGARAHVRFPRRLLAVVAELRAFLRAGAQPPFLASDRRLARAVRLLRVAAFAEGSDSVGELHLLLLQHMLWGQHPSLCGEVRAWLLARLARGAGGGGPATAPELQLLVDGARGRLASRGAVAGALADLSGLRASLERQLVARLGLRGRLRPRLEAASGGLWLTGPELEEARSAMLPRLDASVAEAERLLQQVLELEAVAKVEDDALRRGCLEMEALKFGRSSGDGFGAASPWRR
ncbi:unnamed protein product, partial [Prorocentrum cordatum]